MSLATWYRRLRADNWRVVELERLSVYLEVPLSRFTDGPK